MYKVPIMVHYTFYIVHITTSRGELAQLARAPALHAGGHRFDSDILHSSLYQVLCTKYNEPGMKVLMKGVF